MAVAGLALLAPIDVLIDCPALDGEAIAELDARLHLESELHPSWEGRLLLSCRGAVAHGKHVQGDRLLREEKLEDDGEPLKDRLLRVALELLEAAEEGRGPREDPRDTATQPSAPSASAVETTKQRSAADTDDEEWMDFGEDPPTSGSPFFATISDQWALDAALSYEHLGGDRLGVLGLEIGSAKYLSSTFAPRPFLGGGLVLQPPEGLRVSTLTFGVLLEARVLRSLTMAIGPLYSVMAFSGREQLVSQNSVSAQWGGQLDLGLAPAALTSGVTIALRGRAYARERLVRINEEQVLRVPAWTISLVVGYRFFAQLEP